MYATAQQSQSAGGEEGAATGEAGSESEQGDQADDDVVEAEIVDEDKPAGDGQGGQK